MGLMPTGPTGEAEEINDVFENELVCNVRFICIKFCKSAIGFVYAHANTYIPPKRGAFTHISKEMNKISFIRWIQKQAHKGMFALLSGVGSKPKPRSN